MKKKEGIILLLFSCMLVIYLLCFRGNPVRLSEIMMNEEQLHLITENRQISEERLLEGLFFDEESLFFDVANNTFYYSLEEGNKNAYNPYVKKKTAHNSVSVAFLYDEITPKNIENNCTFKIIAYDATSYQEYNLKCTTLPMMNINCETAIDEESVPMDITLFDNRQGATQKNTTSTGMIHVRGGSTRVYPKKAYRLSLTQKSLGGNRRNNKVALLGMRQDDDWILYPAYNDQEKIRNVFSSNLWKYTCAKDNSLGIDNGMEYKYIELFMNGEYWGLYALGYPIDEQQLEIDIAKGEHLYKKETWEIETFITSEQDSAVTGYKTTESEQDDWSALKQFYTSLHTSWKDSESMYRGIDVDNAIDMYLFINLIQGLDHVGTLGSMSIKNMYLSVNHVDNKEVLLYTPWDMDITWGNEWTGEADKNLISPYGIDTGTNTIMEHGNLQALILNGDDNVWNLIFSKYWELREDLWSEESINAMLDKYEEDIYGSGAYLREMERWPDGTYASADIGLEVFRTYVMERLQTADDYYKKLEELSSKNIYIIRSAQYQNFLESKFIIEINDKELLYDKDYREFLTYIGVDIDTITETTRVIVVDGSNHKVEYFEKLDETGVDTCIGLIELSAMDDRTGQSKVYVEGEEWYLTEANPKKGIQVRFMTNKGVSEFDFAREYIMWSYLIEQQNPLEWCEIIRKDGYSVVIEVINHDVLHDEKFIKLVEGFGIESDHLSKNTDFLIIQEGGKAVTVLDNSHNSGDRQDTVLGSLSVFYNEEGGYGVYLNNEECIVAGMEDNADTDVRIAVMNQEPYEVIWCLDASY